MVIDKQIIIGCQKQNEKFQEQLYHILSPSLYLVCKRFSRDSEEAKDLLQEAFIKIFDKIKKYKFEGSFEGWAKKLTINEILQYLRKKNILNDSEPIDINHELVGNNITSGQKTDMDDLLHLLNRLSPKKKVVFNLFAIEGYSHKEISKMLKISENSSSSTYHKARTQLQSLYIEVNQEAIV